jgi:hypothetical protein
MRSRLRSTICVRIFCICNLAIATGASTKIVGAGAWRRLRAKPSVEALFCARDSPLACQNFIGKKT